MPKRRQQIVMSHDEVVDFLHERLTMAVATMNPDGSIHQTALWYGFHDRAPAFWTYRKAQKVRNLERDPRISGLVEDGARYDELRGVEVVGTGQIISDPEVVLAIGLDVYQRYTAPVTNDVIPVVRQMAAKRVVVRFDVARTVSWDHGKLGGTY